MFCKNCGKEIQDHQHCQYCNQTPGLQPVSGPPPTSGLATASMILGIVSLFFGVLPAIAGLTTGILGLIKINRREATGKGMAVAGIAISIFGLFVTTIVLVAVLLLPALNSAREKARRDAMTSDLKRISLVLKQYAMDYGDYSPDKNGHADPTRQKASNISEHSNKQSSTEE